MTPLARWVAFAVTFGVAYPAFADEEQEFQAAKARLDAGQGTEAASRLGRLLDPSAPACPSTPALTANGCRVQDPEIAFRARGYYVIALLSLERIDDARREVETILRQQPSFDPSPTLFPQSAIDLFIEARGKLADELARIAKEISDRNHQNELSEEAQRKAQREYLAKVEKMASTEIVVEEHSRWIAAIPFGVGQFDNGNIGLGIFFAASGGLLAAAAITTQAIHYDLVGQRAEAGNGGQKNGIGIVLGPSSENLAPDDQALETQLTSLQIANNISLGLLAVTLVAGIIEAEVSFVGSTRTERQRPLPPKPPERTKPKIGVIGVPGAADATGLGLQLTF